MSFLLCTPMPVFLVVSCLGLVWLMLLSVSNRCNEVKNVRFECKVTPKYLNKHIIMRYFDFFL